MTDDETKKGLLHAVKVIALLSERQTQHTKAIDGAGTLLFKHCTLIRSMLPRCERCYDEPATVMACFNGAQFLAPRWMKTCDRCCASNVVKRLVDDASVTELDDAVLIRELNDIVAEHGHIVGTIH